MNWPYCGAAAANAGGGPVGRSPTGLNTNRLALVAARCDPHGAQHAELQGWRAGTSATRSQTIGAKPPGAPRSDPQGHSAVNAKLEQSGSSEPYKRTESEAPGVRSDEHLPRHSYWGQ